MTEEIIEGAPPEKIEGQEEPTITPEGQGEGAETPPLFNEEQVKWLDQHIGSFAGKISAKQIEEKVMPHLNRSPDTPSTNIPNAGSENAMTRFNEQLQQKIFDGDVMGAMQMAQDVRERAKTNLSNAQKVETDKLITALSEQPYYKEIFSDVKDIAHKNVSKGIPPQVAVELAHAQAKANHLEKQMGGGSGADTDNLGMLGGGKPSPKGKGVTLSPEMKAAAQRDIADGLYKNEKEWADNLDPKIRKQYGLD